MRIAGHVKQVNPYGESPVCRIYLILIRWNVCLFACIQLLSIRVGNFLERRVSRLDMYCRSVLRLNPDLADIGMIGIWAKHFLRCMVRVL